VMEMINGHALVISLMATALVSSRVSRFFAPPLYETLALRYLAPPVAAAEPAAATAASATVATGVTEPQDAAAAPADPLDTLRDEGGKGDDVPPAATPAEGGAHAPAPHDDEPAAAGTNGPAQPGQRDTQ
jgi:hypothetical protein